MNTIGYDIEAVAEKSRKLKREGIMKKAYYILPLIILLLLGFSHTGKGEETYRDDINKGNYKQALKSILKEIDVINSTRVDDKSIPTDFITLVSEKQIVNINRMFRERTAQPFFIEDNEKLYSLHSAAGKCLYETRVYDDAMNHYYQALRFRKFTGSGEDEIFYGIAKCCEKNDKMQGYLDALETASSINPRNYDYSLELGRALYRTAEKKKSIYHLERYAVIKGKDLAELDVLIKLAGLNEDIHRYLESERYYIQYLEKKPNDAFIHYALGYTAFMNTGNYELAQSELGKSLELFPDVEIYRKSKAYEFIGDMKYKLLRYNEAIDAYLETIKYQDKVQKEIEENDRQIKQLEEEIVKIKAILLKERNFVQYNEYQFQMQEKEKIIVQRREKRYEYNKLNPGKSRWNIAECYEKSEKYKEAIVYYRQSIQFSYKSNEAREKIIKIQLKIKRGY